MCRSSSLYNIDFHSLRLNILESLYNLLQEFESGKMGAKQEEEQSRLQTPNPHDAITCSYPLQYMRDGGRGDIGLYQHLCMDGC
jgi:hypothetical protein